MTFNECRNQSLLSTWTHSILPAWLENSHSFVTEATCVLLTGIQTTLSVLRKAAACCSRLATQLAMLAQDFYMSKKKNPPCALFSFKIHQSLRKQQICGSAHCDGQEQNGSKPCINASRLGESPALPSHSPRVRRAHPSGQPCRCSCSQRCRGGCHTVLSVGTLGDVPVEHLLGW